MENEMNKAVLVIFLILFVFLIMAPAILWINYRFNDNPEELDDLSEENLMKLNIKKGLLNMLEKWSKENDLSYEQTADRLAVNLSVVSDIVHHRFNKFTMDRLVDLVLRTGQPVKFVVTSKDE